MLFSWFGASTTRNVYGDVDLRDRAPHRLLEVVACVDDDVHAPGSLERTAAQSLHHRDASGLRLCLDLDVQPVRSCEADKIARPLSRAAKAVCPALAAAEDDRP